MGKKRSCSKVADWSKSSIHRFNQTNNKVPGPGSYQVMAESARRANSLSAPFAYQGLRSCMDEMIYKTKMPFKVKVIEEKKLKDRYPGPGYYNPKPVEKTSFHSGLDNFGSCSLYNNRLDNE